MSYDSEITIEEMDKTDMDLKVEGNVGTEEKEESEDDGTDSKDGRRGRGKGRGLTPKTMA